MKDSQYKKSYKEFVDAGRGKINKLMDKVLLLICLTASALLAGKLAGIFQGITYLHIGVVFVVSVALSVGHHIVIKKFSVTKHAGIFVLLSLDVLLIAMANAHIGIYITLFLVPMLSIIYYDKAIYFESCIINYVCTVIIGWTTSSYYAGRDLNYLANNKSWFINRMAGYTIETILMTAVGYCLVNTIVQNAEQLYNSVSESKIDKLTGILNRKAYEEDKDKLISDMLPEKLVLVYVDINNLKTVNDQKGHSAGDELIHGAASCMVEVLAPYGKIYRTGGDEFISILQTEIEAPLLMQKLRDCVKGWKGEAVDCLSLSIGYASVGENPEDSYKVLEYKAEQMMYDDKERFYKESGLDRRRK